MYSSFWVMISSSSRKEKLKSIIDIIISSRDYSYNNRYVIIIIYSTLSQWIKEPLQFGVFKYTHAHRATFVTRIGHQLQSYGKPGLQDSWL